MAGWIKLHRQITENWIYGSERFCKFSAWVDLLLSAAHKPNKVMINGHLIDLPVGGLCVSQLSLAKRWGWSRNTVKSFLVLLESEHMIEHVPNAVTTVIVITNWSEYQGIEQQIEQQKGNGLSNDRASLEQGLSTNKNVKNDKNVKKEQKPPTPKTNSFDFDGWKAIEKLSSIPNFEIAWNNWIKFRADIKHPYKTQGGIDGTLKKLSQLSDPVASVEQSIANEWQGLFPPKDNNNASNRSSNNSNPGSVGARATYRNPNAVADAEKFAKEIDELRSHKRSGTI